MQSIGIITNLEQKNYWWRRWFCNFSFITGIFIYFFSWVYRWLLFILCVVILNKWTTSYSTSFLHKLWILTDYCRNTVYYTPAQRTCSTESYVHLLFFFFFHRIFHHLCLLLILLHIFLSKWKREEIKNKLGHHTNCTRLNHSCIRCYFKLIWVGKFSVYLFDTFSYIRLCWLYNNGNNNNNNWRP